MEEKINNIFHRIIESEDNWKAIYMAVWGYSRDVLRKQYEDTPDWGKPIRFGLPASKNGYHTFIPMDLCRILTTQDIEFTLQHLQTMFSLLEEFIQLIIDNYLILPKFKASVFSELKGFLKSDPPFEKFNLNIGDAKINDLHLAKETRNCYIHKNSKIDQLWIRAYEKAKGVKPDNSIGDSFGLMFNEVEEWHRLIIDLSNQIKSSIKEFSSR